MFRNNYQPGGWQPFDCSVPVYELNLNASGIACHPPSGVSKNDPREGFSLEYCKVIIGWWERLRLWWGIHPFQVQECHRWRGNVESSTSKASQLRQYTQLYLISQSCGRDIKYWLLTKTVFFQLARVLGNFTSVPPSDSSFQGGGRLTHHFGKL